MSEATMSNVLLMHKQDRNVNNQMFGGHLMRVALETAWANAYRFCKAPPVVSAINHINFFKPVAIGSIVQLDASVAYVKPENNTLLCGVTLEMQDPSTHTSQLTNDMQFIFKAPDSNQPLPRVVPHSYEEVLRYLAARRRLESELNGGCPHH